MDLKGTLWEAVDRINLAQDEVQFQAFLNTIMNLQVS
jgi:hypothetical protein